MSSSIAAPSGSRPDAVPQNRAPARVALSARRSSSSGIWVGVFAITMSFAAFTSALFVREGTADWGHLVLPPILYVNTLFLLASSGTLEAARRYLRRSEGAAKSGSWVAITLMLGLGFCAGQYRAWLDLRGQGIYLATNPNSSFFYVLTFMHALHVLAGLIALAYLAYRLTIRSGMVRRGVFDNTAVYWHFMTALWVYLLVLCRMKL